MAKVTTIEEVRTGEIEPGIGEATGSGSSLDKMIDDFEDWVIAHSERGRKLADTRRENTYDATGTPFKERCRVNLMRSRAEVEPEDDEAEGA